jgi:Uma2 family endonuclease
MSTTESITTASQLLTATDLGRCELVRGVLIMMSPAGFEHGAIAIALGAKIQNFVDARGLGVVTGAETGFYIERDPDTVRAPDVGFVSRDRMPPRPIRGFFPGAPDLAVEVLSPDDSASEVLDKTQQWLAAGARAVWLVDPRKRTVSVYTVDGPLVVHAVGADLPGEPVLPGFRLSVAEIFPA